MIASSQPARLDAETVKAAITLERVVEKYTALRPKGKELWACCLIHKEKTPSFAVKPETQEWYCQGCGQGGDVFAFIKAVEGVTFPQAIDMVAEFAGLAGSGAVEQKGGRGEPMPVGLVSPTPAPAQPATPVKWIVPMHYVETYDYTDTGGNVVYRIERHEGTKLEDGEEKRVKDFYQKRPNGEWGLGDVERVLYGLPDVIAADTVHVCEGEKDVHSLEALGLVATTNSGGANGKWTPAMVEALRGKTVVILPDQDQPGQKRGKELEVALQGIAATIFTVNVPSGKDVTDYIEAGGDACTLIDGVVNQQKRDQLERDLCSPEEVLWLAGGAAAFLDKRAPGVPTGFRDYDWMTGGMYPGEVTVIAARPGMGKTAFAMQAGEFIARKSGPVAAFSMEMSKRSLLTRLVCSNARVSQHALRTGQLTSDDRRKLQYQVGLLGDLPLFIDDTAGLTVPEMRRKLAAFVKKYGKPSLVIVDYLQLMSSEGKVENRTNEVSTQSRQIKIAAREIGAPFMLLSQLSRAGEATTDKRPQLQHLRDSGGIEQDADIVAFIYREEVYAKRLADGRVDPQIAGLAEVILAKHRNGEIGPIKMLFKGAFTRFENLERGEMAA